MEMHSDWWILTGIQKPVFGKDGLVSPAPWERSPLTRNPLTSLTFVANFRDIMLV